MRIISHLYNFKKNIYERKTRGRKPKIKPRKQGTKALAFMHNRHSVAMLLNAGPYYYFIQQIGRVTQELVREYSANARGASRDPLTPRTFGFARALDRLSLRDTE